MRTLLFAVFATTAVAAATPNLAHQLDTSSFAAATSDATTSSTIGNVAVDTPLGLVIGTNEDPRFANSNGNNNVDAFLGLQFGIIPSRFTKSRTSTTQNDYTYQPGVRQANGSTGAPYIDATNFGPYCYQSIDNLPFYEDQEQSEDCLYLNIWRPRGTNPQSELSVMVLIGNGFNIQGAPQPPSWGHNLAREENVMVISINYRLGVFGFMATDEEGSNGMNGVDDQSKYISYFISTYDMFISLLMFIPLHFKLLPSSGYTSLSPTLAVTRMMLH